MASPRPLTQVSQKPLHGSKPNITGSYNYISTAFFFFKIQCSIFALPLDYVNRPPGNRPHEIEICPSPVIRVAIISEPIHSVRLLYRPPIVKSLYYVLVYSYLTYGIEVWRAAKKCAMNKIEIMQKRVVRCIGLGNYMNPTSPIFKRLHILKLQNLQDIYSKAVDPLLQRFRSSTSTKPIVTNKEVHVNRTRQRARQNFQRASRCRLQGDVIFSYSHTFPWNWQRGARREQFLFSFQDSVSRKTIFLYKIVISKVFTKAVLWISEKFRLQIWAIFCRFLIGPYESKTFKNATAINRLLLILSFLWIFISKSLFIFWHFANWNFYDTLKIYHYRLWQKLTCRGTGDVLNVL